LAAEEIANPEFVSSVGPEDDPDVGGAEDRVLGDAECVGVARIL